MKSTASSTPIGIFAIKSERVDAGQPHAEETPRRNSPRRSSRREIAAQCLAGLDGMPPICRMKSTSSWAKSLVVL
jgi:hypothetical protein